MRALCRFRRVPFRAALAIALWIYTSTFHFAWAGTNAAASFTITSPVLASSPPRFGFNLEQSCGAVDITDNAWIADGGFSSWDNRLDFAASNDGAADGTTFICTPQNYMGWGTDYYDSIVNGTYNGAQARVYRFNSTTNAWTLVRTAVVQTFTAGASTDTATLDHTITFTTPGAQSKAGDAIWVSQDANININVWVNYITSRLAAYGNYARTWAAEGDKGFIVGDTSSCQYIHVTDVPPGQTNGTADAPPLSLQVTDTVTETAGIWQYVQGFGTAGTSDTSEQFEPGHTYTVSVWLKQQGIANGTATFLMGPLSHSFSGITNQWQLFTYNFPAPATVNSTITARVDYNAPGTLWVNQLRFYDASHNAFSLDPRALQTFQNFHPGIVRFWSNFANTSENYSYWSLDSWLQDESASRGDPGIGNINYLFSEQHKLPDAMALASQLGANPWFICNMSLNEQEWSNLIDYLPPRPGWATQARGPQVIPAPTRRILPKSISNLAMRNGARKERPLTTITGSTPTIC